jgi:hypothetical protein
MLASSLVLKSVESWPEQDVQRSVQNGLAKSVTLIREGAHNTSHHQIHRTLSRQQQHTTRHDLARAITVHVRHGDRFFRTTCQVHRVTETQKRFARNCTVGQARIESSNDLIFSDHQALNIFCATNNAACNPGVH